MIDPNELLFCVDKHNRPVMPQPKIQVHNNHIWHRNSHVWVIDPGGTSVLCHKRSLFVHSNQGKWEAPFAGHSKVGETPLQTALTELFEESGIVATTDSLVFHFTHVHVAPHNNEFISVYSTFWKGSLKKLNTQSEEVADVCWYTYSELSAIFTAVRSTWVQIGYEKDMLKKLQKFSSKRVSK